MPILDPNRAYTFSQIFELGVDAIDLVPEYGYSLVRLYANQPQFQGPLPDVERLHHDITEILLLADFSNQQARRELLVAPITQALSRQVRARISIEHSIRVSAQLQGNLDYLLRASTQFLVIEAKKEDMDNGFTQLAVEMIALDQWERAPGVEVQPTLVGAISTGRLWQFAVLHRQQRRIEQDLHLYRVPEDLETLLRILVGVFQPSTATTRGD